MRLEECMLFARIVRREVTMATVSMAVRSRKLLVIPWSMTHDCNCNDRRDVQKAFPTVHQHDATEMAPPPYTTLTANHPTGWMCPRTTPNRSRHRSGALSLHTDRRRRCLEGTIPP